MYAVIIAGRYCAGLLPLLAAQSCECAILRAELPRVAAFMTKHSKYRGRRGLETRLSMTVALLLLCCWWSTVHVIVAAAY